MRVSTCMHTLFAGTLWLVALSCSAQTHQQAAEDARFEIAATFDAVHANTVAGDNFWMKGGGVQASIRIARHWSAVADFSVLHTGVMPNTTAGLDLTSIAFGPRYTVFSEYRRLSVFGQALGGVSHGSNSLFASETGTSTSANGSALLLGGGIDYRASHHISARVLDIGWLRTTLSNGTTTVQNNLRMGSGLAFQF